MSGDVLTNDLRDRRNPTLVISAALAVLAAFAISIGAGMGEALNEMTEAFPEALNTFIGADAPGGYVVNEVFELIAPFALIAFVVTAGASVIAGEEQRKTMSMLIAQPLTRTSVLTSKVVSVLITLAFAILVFWAAIAISVSLVEIELGIGDVAAASVHLFFLAAFFGSVALAVGAATGRPEMALAVGGGLAVLSWLSKSMLELADLDRWAQLSPWYYYSGSNPLTEGIDYTHLLVLAGLTVIAMVLAYRTFTARDLKG